MKVAPKRPHFYTPILPGFKNGLTVPISFLKYLEGHDQHEHAILRKGGKKWLVKVNGRRFEEGWEKFVEELDLQLGYILVFRHEGNMEFEVSVFDSSHLDREYAEYQQEKAHITVEETSENFELKEKQISIGIKPSGHSHFLCTIPSYCLSRGYLSVPIQFAIANGLANKKCGLIIRDLEGQRSWNLKLSSSKTQVYIGDGWRKFVADNCLKKGDHIMFEVVTIGETPIWNFRFVTNGETPMRKFQGTRKVSRNKPSVSVADEHPYFISTIKPYSISRSSLHLPLDFAKLNGLINRKCEMILKDEAQKSWTVSIRRINAKHFGITRGWNKFKAANGLRVGDVYKFELIKNGKIPVAHFHNLRGSPPHQTELQKNTRNLDNKKISDIGLNFQVQTELEIETTGVTAPKSQEPAPTSAAAIDDDDDDDANPHFVSTIKPYTISYSVLYLPIAFAKSNGLLSRTEMILVDEKGRPWSMQLGLKGGEHFCIRGGWTDFRKANGIRVGDPYKFELINNDIVPIAYFHCKNSGEDAN